MDVDTALSRLQAPSQLSILTLSHPLLEPRTPNKRASDVSENPDRTPSALQADHVHYQELFAKLRFSYVEQVTKERFLRAVIASPPEFVKGAQNAELEAELKDMKAGLKDKKAEVRAIIGELEETGRELVARYEGVELQTRQLESLPDEITELQARMKELESAAQIDSPHPEKPELSMRLQPTLELLSGKEAKLTDLDARIASLQRKQPEKQRVISGLESELEPLRFRKEAAVKSANEAKRGKENGGLGDDLELQGRWLRGVEAGLKGMLEV
ncbi:hypothetical protein B0A48_11507 [Cryoendolithus antarcticus]|uniref:Kinetochore protein Sos7 coiled-coil domain-containing protein n=1 Tax=Cryoendolithus antarcticus TaxID=1507870 RepID=A0A1V8SW28_9PEZI|nr:hypothetical protein B0A48_11507 [Cryoendolithus antarcticus]